MLYEKIHKENIETAGEYTERLKKRLKVNENNKIETILLDNIELNLAKLYELQNISDSLHGIIQWFIITVILLGFILYKIW